MPTADAVTGAPRAASVRAMSARRSSAWLVAALAPVILVLACARAEAQRPPPYTLEADFWKHWGDGQAELSGYALRFPRYGVVRTGTAVAIFVTETFSKVARVKADPGRHPKDDEFPVMKLNWVQSFPTGIYDYDTMLSTFVALADNGLQATGEPTKIAYSSQEWCGHVYSQVRLERDVAQFTSHSYFDGEGDQDGPLARPADAIAEDALMLWARGLAAPVVAPGATVERKLLRSLERVRLEHKPIAYVDAKLSRGAAPETITHRGGEVRVERFVAEADVTTTFFVEIEAPRRVLRVQRSDGLEAELLATTRNKYWMLNAPGGERALSRLGLRAP